MEVFGGDSKIINSTVILNTPSGVCGFITFQLLDQEFMALTGPVFKFNPSILFFVNCDPSRGLQTKENLKKPCDQLIVKGKALMELNEYPFSPYYGWIEDKYGVSWQLILTNPEDEPRPQIVPYLLSFKKKNKRSRQSN